MRIIEPAGVHNPCRAPPGKKLEEQEPGRPVLLSLEICRRPATGRCMDQRVV
ncbi:MAG: hypothetical protein WCH85_05360 [Methanomicrobiales archaeon]